MDEAWDSVRTLSAGHDDKVFKGTPTRGQDSLTMIPKDAPEFYRSKVDPVWKVVGEFREPVLRTNANQTEVPT